MGHVFRDCEIHGDRQEVHYSNHLAPVCLKCYNEDPEKYDLPLTPLERLGKLMREQDNRATAPPYLYVLQEQKMLMLSLQLQSTLLL